MNVERHLPCWYHAYISTDKQYDKSVKTKTTPTKFETEPHHNCRYIHKGNYSIIFNPTDAII